MKYGKYVKLAAMSLMAAAFTIFLDDMRADEIAEAAADKAVSKLSVNQKEETPVHKNRAQRRAEMRRGR